MTCLAPALAANLWVCQLGHTVFCDSASVHAQDAGAAAYVEDDLVFKYVPVVDDCVSVRAGTDFIFLISLSVLFLELLRRCLPASPHECLAR